MRDCSSGSILRDTPLARRSTKKWHDQAMPRAERPFFVPLGRIRGRIHVGRPKGRLGAGFRGEILEQSRICPLRSPRRAAFAWPR